MILKFGICILVAAIAFPAPAKAHIICDGTFQVISNRDIFTPFCQDEDLSRRTRSQGVKTTGEAVRQSPGLKPLRTGG